MSNEWYQDKLDRVSTDVAELKVKVSHMDEKLDKHMTDIKEHVAGDKKIINELVPVLDKLPTIVEMAEEHRFYTRSKQKRREKIKDITSKLTIASIIVGICVGVIKILGAF